MKWAKWIQLICIEFTVVAFVLKYSRDVKVMNVTLETKLPPQHWTSLHLTLVPQNMFCQTVRPCRSPTRPVRQFPAPTFDYLQKVIVWKRLQCISRALLPCPPGFLSTSHLTGLSENVSGVGRVCGDQGLSGHRRNGGGGGGARWVIISQQGLVQMFASQTDIQHYRQPENANEK